MSCPLLDIAMSYVHSSAPALSDASALADIRTAFSQMIAGESPGPVSALLLTHTGKTDAVDRISAILAAEGTPPPKDPPPSTDRFHSFRHRPRAWTKAEDVRLLAGIHKHGLEDWTSVAKFVGGGRNRAQCAQRWTRGLDPRISTDQWSPEDEAKLIRLLSGKPSIGWTQIAVEMENRSDVQCRYHFFQMRKQGKVPPGLPDVGMDQRVKKKIPRMQVRMRLPLPQAKGSLQRRGEPPPPKCEVADAPQKDEEPEYIDLFAQREEDNLGWMGSAGSQRNMRND
jgi:hypothetical protein